MTQKIFCIGFHKTATTSLATALRKLNYRVTGPNGVNDINIQNNALRIAFDLVEKFDAFQDNPWPIIYKELDRKYTHSKFILTTRNSEQWIKSLISHFGESETPMRKWIYGKGSPLGNEQTYVNRFENHNKEVLEYFKERVNDLLIMDITKGDDWEKLCAYLNLPKPDTPFPHVNKSTDRTKNTIIRRGNQNTPTR